MIGTFLLAFPEEETFRAKDLKVTTAFAELV